VLRDIRQTRTLAGVGWRSFRAWEHEVFTQLGELVLRVKALIAGGVDDSLDSWRVVMVLPDDTNGDFERRTLITLRDGAKQQVEIQKRHTRKWKRQSRTGRLNSTALNT